MVVGTFHAHRMFTCVFDLYRYSVARVYTLCESFEWLCVYAQITSLDVGTCLSIREVSLTMRYCVRIGLTVKTRTIILSCCWHVYLRVCVLNSSQRLMFLISESCKTACKSHLSIRSCTPTKMLMTGNFITPNKSDETHLRDIILQYATYQLHNICGLSIIVFACESHLMRRKTSVRLEFYMA